MIDWMTAPRVPIMMPTRSSGTFIKAVTIFCAAADAAADAGAAAAEPAAAVDDADEDDDDELELEAVESSLLAPFFKEEEEDDDEEEREPAPELRPKPTPVVLSPMEENKLPMAATLG